MRELVGQPPFDPERLAHTLARFYRNNLNLALDAIILAITDEPTLSKENVFERLSHGRGSPSTHISGRPEGEPRVGFAVRGGSRSRKRNVLTTKRNFNIP